MVEFLRTTGRLTAAVSLAASLLLGSMPVSLAGPGDTNSTNVGANVANGTFFNTAGDKTTFTNNGGNITVGAGTTVRGLEVNSAGNLTGNGGHLHFDAQGGVMRVDGTINASAAMGSNGAYLGNGGKVTIDAGALVQNGNIFANGLNGGIITVNVGQLTVGPNARFEALTTGAYALPGQINLNATGEVTIPNGAVLDASGNYIGGYNANVIQISGSVVNLDGVVIANGLSAGAKGGNIGIYGSEIAVKSNAKIMANGANTGDGGMVEVISTDKTTVESGAEITANGGKGLSGVVAGNGGIVGVGSAKTLRNDGVISANGGNGHNGYNPSNGGEGGLVVFAGDTVEHNGQLAANGGHGGTNAFPSRGTVVNGQQVSVGQNGANGGNGGAVLVAHRTSISGTGSIEAKGGNGGNGQEAIADANHAHQTARGGNGGDAGFGGLVRFHGDPGQTIINNVNVNGGSGGQGGYASVASDCGCATPGAGGACGAPGQIEIVAKPPCSGGADCSPTPPQQIPGNPTTPISPLFPLYPKEYGNLGDTLPPNAGNVLSYTRSIFLARSPVPIIRKKVVVPPPQPPAKIMVVQPQPKPVQKKVPVRGYW
ncbi:hypothetical protein [Vampirovibrio sp.]|uniref:hypothetical protein n=1 Tax=Vampirovibrio sp. TaxID=2717857 RepID=UPI003593A9FB